MNEKAIRFIFKQIYEIREGGLPVLFRKLSILFRKLFDIAMTLLAMPVVLVVRAVRPLILIRFGHMQSERIGHFAANTELYLCNRDIKGDRPIKSSTRPLTESAARQHTVSDQSENSIGYHRWENGSCQTIDIKQNNGFYNLKMRG